MKKRAFTLAELLIAMVILGVIAALTLPSLLQIHQQAGAGALLSKIQATIEDATGRIIVENPDEKLVEESFADKLKNFLMMKKVSTGWKLKDGTILAFSKSYQPVPENAGETFLDVDVDLNGKGWPNKWGVDKFTFALSSEGFMYPIGCTAKLASNNWKPNKDYDIKTCEEWNRCPGTSCTGFWKLNIKKCGCDCTINQSFCTNKWDYEFKPNSCTCEPWCGGKTCVGYRKLNRGTCNCDCIITDSDCSPSHYGNREYCSCFPRCTGYEEWNGSGCTCTLTEEICQSQGKIKNGCICVDPPQEPQQPQQPQEKSCSDRGGKECDGICSLDNKDAYNSCVCAKKNQVWNGSACETPKPEEKTKCPGLTCNYKQDKDESSCTCKCKSTYEECGGECLVKNGNELRACQCNNTPGKEWKWTSNLHITGACVVQCPNGTRYNNNQSCCTTGTVCGDKCLSGKELSKCQCESKSGMTYNASSNTCKPAINCSATGASINPATGLCELTIGGYCAQWNGYDALDNKYCGGTSALGAVSVPSESTVLNKFEEGLVLQTMLTSAAQNNLENLMGSVDAISWTNDLYREVLSEVMSTVKIVEVDYDNWTGNVPSGYDIAVIRFGNLSTSTLYANQYRVNNEIINRYNQRVQQKYNELIKM